jgi:hypothetical protein
MHAIKCDDGQGRAGVELLTLLRNQNPAAMPWLNFEVV